MSWWIVKDAHSAIAKGGEPFAFPKCCVCCLDPDVEFRDVDTLATPFLFYPDGKGGFIRESTSISLHTPNVPYCASHAAEYDAHLAWQRLSRWERLRTRKKTLMPPPKPVGDDKKAEFSHNEEAYSPEGALGMQIKPTPDWRRKENGKVAIATIDFHFQNAEYARLFREANSLPTAKEWDAARKEQKQKSAV